MAKRILLTVILVLVGCASFSVGLISCRTAGKPQAQEAKSAQGAGTSAAASQAARGSSQDVITREGGRVASFLIPDLNADRGVQKALVDKSTQIFGIWATLKTSNGVINLLQSAQTAGSESLSPLDIIMQKLSDRLSFAFSAILFWKILLTISSYMVFLIVIPVCIIIAIITLWTNKNKKRVPRIIFASLLIGLVVSFAIPLAMQLATLLDKQLISHNVNALVTSVEAKGRTADALERNVSAARRQGSAVVNFIPNAKTLGNGVIEDVINYFNIFVFIYILIPIVFLLVLFFVIRRFLKLILA